MKRTNLVRVELLGMTGEGRTQREAKLDAEGRITDFVSSDFAPLLLQRGGCIAFMWRGRYGYEYSITPMGKDWKRGDFSICYGEDRATCEAAMRRHLAQNVFDVTDRTSAHYTAAFLSSQSDQENHLRWCEWQYCVRAWRDAGESVEQARTRADKLEWPQGATPFEIKKGEH